MLTVCSGVAAWPGRSRVRMAAGTVVSCLMTVAAAGDSLPAGGAEVSLDGDRGCDGGQHGGDRGDRRDEAAAGLGALAGGPLSGDPPANALWPEGLAASWTTGFQQGGAGSLPPDVPSSGCMAPGPRALRPAYYHG